MNKRTTISALFLGAAILVTNCPIAAMEGPGTSKENPIYFMEVKDERPLVLSTGAKIALGAMLPVVAGWILLYSRKSEKEFTTRFDSAKVTNPSKLFSKDGVKNLWYFISDELIGQRKLSSTLKMREDKKIYPSDETPAYGVLGKIDATAAPLAEAAAKFTAPFTGIAALWIAMKHGAHKAAAVIPVRVKEAPAVEPVVEAEQAADVAVPVMVD